MLTHATTVHQQNRTNDEVDGLVAMPVKKRACGQISLILLAHVNGPYRQSAYGSPRNIRKGNHNSLKHGGSEFIAGPTQSELDGIGHFEPG